MTTDYELLNRQLQELLQEESDWVCILANAAALLMDQLPEINWVRFYLLRDRELLLGPFQGKPACMHIPLGQGVCGTAFEQRQTLRVANVHEFPGHIACDTASNSEIVVPLQDQNGEWIGVLDVDSPILNRFSAADQTGLELIARTLGRMFLLR